MIKNSTFRSLATVLFLSTAAAATPALAQSSDFDPEGGVYISVQAGVTSPTDETFEGIQAPDVGSPGAAGAPAVVDAGFDEGFVGTVAVGYRIPTRFLGLFQPSFEVEYSYAESDVSGGSFNGGDQIFGGDTEVNTFSINYQSDVRWSEGQKLIPFWGGGIGIADVDSNITYFPNNGIATAPTFAVTDGGTGLSLQSNIGLQYVLSDNIELQGRVRYQRVSGLDFERTFVGSGGEIFNADLDGNFETVSFLAGVRFRF
ncbi:MAG: outer membrane beta-barrel protein [Erythrobacter sp.]